MSGPVGRPHPCVPLPFSAIHGGSPLYIQQLQEPLGSSEKRPVLMPFCPAHLLFASPQHHRLTPLSTLWTLELNCHKVIYCSPMIFCSFSRNHCTIIPHTTLLNYGLTIGVHCYIYIMELIDTVYCLAYNMGLFNNVNRYIHRIE